MGVTTIGRNGAFTLAPQIIRVGTNGDFATIASAVDWINAQPSIQETLHTTTLNLTADDLTYLTMDDALDQDNTKGRNLYLKLASHPFLYPVELVVASEGSTGTQLRVKYPIVGLPTGSQAAVIVSPTKHYLISLMPGSHEIAAGTEVTLPPFTNVVGHGKGVSVVYGDPDTNIGILNCLPINGRNEFRDFSIIVEAANSGGSCISVENYNATVATTGYEFVCRGLDVRARVGAIDGIHVKAGMANTTDWVDVSDCETQGLYDTVAILSARRLRVVNNVLRSKNAAADTSTPPTGVNIGGCRSGYPTIAQVLGNHIECINDTNAIGAAAIGIQVTSNTATTAANLVGLFSNNYIKTYANGNLTASSYGVYLQQSAGAPAHVVMGRSNIFDCTADVGTPYDVYAFEGTYLSAGDRKISGAAIDTGATAPGAVTVEL